MPNVPRFLLSGARPGIGAGNAVSSQVLLDALSVAGEVDLLSHEVAILPRLRSDEVEQRTHYRIGAFPFLLHGEGALAGAVHAPKFRKRQYSFAWAVNSRYASALAAAHLPYAIWEATTIRDELYATSAHETRSAGRGTGLAAMVHRIGLPLDERLEGRLYARSCSTMAMSEYGRDRIVQRHPAIAGRIGILSHPPTRAFLGALERARGEARATGRVHGPRLLCVGRLDDPRKNTDLLLAACSRLRATWTDLQLTLVGSSAAAWQRSRRQAMADAGAEMKGVVSVDELAVAYLTHDLLVVPSRQEGFGIVVAEALHAGLPVVATACGGPETVITASKAGVVAGDSPDTLADGIRYMLADPHRLARASRLGEHYARTNLSPAGFERAVHDLIESAVKTGTSSHVTSSGSRVVARMS